MKAGWALAAAAAISLAGFPAGAAPSPAPGKVERITITSQDFQALDRPGASSPNAITENSPEIRQARQEEAQERKAAAEAFDRAAGINKNDPEWLKQLKRQHRREVQQLTARYERLLAQTEASYQTLLNRQEHQMAALERRYQQLFDRAQAAGLNPPQTAIESVIITPYPGTVYRPYPPGPVFRRRR